MNVIATFTKKSLLHHKTWSLVTLFGIIISVALLTGIASLSQSFLLYLRQMEISNQGEWHVQITTESNVSNKLITNPYFDRVSSSLTVGFAKDSKLTEKPYVKLSSMSESAQDTYLVNVTSGRFPENSNEIMLPNTLESKVNIQDIITLGLGQRMFEQSLLDDQSFYMTNYQPLENGEWLEIHESLENIQEHAYVVVGFYESSVLDKSYQPFTTAITSGESVTNFYPYTYTMTFSSFSRNFVEETQMELSDIDVLSSTFNTGLLRYYGVIANDSQHTVFYGLISTIVAIVMIASIALIYNSFSMSLSQRIRQLGMLASIGATKAQLRSHVFLEAFYLFIPATTIGILSGILGIGVTLRFIEPLMFNLIGSSGKLSLSVSPTVILVSIALSLVTILLSVWIPAIRFSNMSVIDALSERKEVKINQKKLETPRIVSRLFGHEGELAHKNTQRNRKKFRTTVISLSVSVVLFMSVSYFISNMFHLSRLGYSDINTDIYIHMRNENKDQRKSIVNQLSILDHIDAFAAYSLLHTSAQLNDVPLSSQALEFFKQVKPNMDQVEFVITVMDDASFQDYTKQMNIKDTQFTKDSMEFILVNLVKHTDYQAESTYFQSIMNETSVSFPMRFRHSESGNPKSTMDASIVAFTENIPLGRSIPSFSQILLVTNEASVDSIFDESFLHPTLNTYYYYTEIAIKTSADVEVEKEANAYLSSFTDVRHFSNNYTSERMQLESIKLIIQIFLYGFITLIALISVSNIINTMTTSIQLRKREFAMLKSVGMEPSSFKKMIQFESIYYGLNTLLLSIPLSIAAMFGVRWVISEGFEYTVPFPYTHFIFIFLIVFTIVLITMSVTTKVVMKENMIDAIKNEA